MATADELTALRRLAGKHLPVGAADPVDFTDEELAAVLDALPRCNLATNQGADVYLAAARLWEDKALARELEDTATGGSAPLVNQVSQGDASATYTRPVPLGSTVTAPNDPTAMRVLAGRLRRRSCNGGTVGSRDVLPPMSVTDAPRGIREYDGGDSLYTDPRPAILGSPVLNPDRVINLPEPD